MTTDRDSADYEPRTPVPRPLTSSIPSNSTASIRFKASMTPAKCPSR